MPRKILILLAALLVPGGIIALVGALAFKAFSRSARGRQVLAQAQKRVPSWASSWTLGAPQQRRAA